MNSSSDLIKLPDLSFDNLEEIMKERISETVTDKTVIPMLWQGLLEIKIPAGGIQRTAKLFVPKDTPQGTVFVLMNVPEGEETVSFLQKSGWIAKAQECGFCLFVLEPGPGGWQEPDLEMPYIMAGFQAEIQGIYCLPAFSMYVAGYGAIGVCLHKAVMQDPLHVASAAFLDAGDVETSFLEEFSQKTYDRYHVACKDVPVPVLISARTLSPQAEAMAEYWRRAAHADLREDDPEGTLFRQNAPSPFTPEGNILKVRISRRAFPYADPDTTDRIWAFLSGYYRYGSGPCSNMLSQKADYRRLGVDRRAFTDRNGYRREYLVYIPESVRGGEKKLPVVVAIHGASQSMRNMFENGLWYRIAEREGFMLVVPECTFEPLPDWLNGGLAHAWRPLWGLIEPDSTRHHQDAEYFDEMLDRVLSEYPADPARIYCTGHSMGCMMTNYLGSSFVSRRFAALGAMCGNLWAREYTGTGNMPVFLTMGEFDLWDYDVTADTKVTEALDMWLIRNGLAGESDVRAKRKSGASQAYQEGRRHHYVWSDDAGTPWVRYAWIEKRDHMNSPEENEMFWKEWFSRWKIGENGIRQYMEP